MKLRLHLDEDSAGNALVQALRARGVDVLTVQEAQMRSRSDAEQLRYATEQSRAIYTQNARDFQMLHAKYLEQGLSHAGIILAEQQRRYSIGEQMRRLLHLIASKSAEEMTNNVQYLSAWGEEP